MHPIPEDVSREERPGTEPVAATGPAEEGPSKLFPYNTVVGVIDDAESLEMAVQTLAAAGFAESSVQVLSGERGVERIDARGERKGILARIFRLVDALGSEREHTERHVEELRAGHFLVLVQTTDDAGKARARDALTAQGGHYINYYSRWTTEQLTP